MENHATLAERLGYSKQDRLWIIHGDDMGMCHSANVGTIRALEIGGITSASVMVPCPWFPEAAAWARDNPNGDIGVHLTLTSEWKHYRWKPVLPVSEVPSLVDEDGFMWKSMPDVVKHAEPEHVELELRAQIERALQFGMQPTHIDSHMGTVFHAKFFPSYIKMSREFNLPGLFLTPTPPTLQSAAKREFHTYPDFVDQLRDYGIPLIDSLTDIPEADTVEGRWDQFKRMIDTLPAGVTQTIVHLNMDDDEIRHIAGSWRKRHQETVILTNPKARQLIEDAGIHLIGYRELMPLVQRTT